MDISFWPAFCILTFMFGVYVGYGQGEHAGWWRGWKECKDAWDRWENMRLHSEQRKLGKLHQ